MQDTANGRESGLQHLECLIFNEEPDAAEESLVWTLDPESSHKNISGKPIPRNKELFKELDIANRIANLGLTNLHLVVVNGYHFWLLVRSILN